MDVGEEFAVIEARGIGYQLRVPRSTAMAIGSSSWVRLYTSLRIRDEHMLLYGFATQEEREIFERICTISGVGAGTALAILSGIPIEEFRSAVLAGQAQVLQRVKGIGRKTAERLVLELKEVFATAEGVAVSAGARQLAGDAIDAMITLGSSIGEAEHSVRLALQKLPASASLEQVIKFASGLGRKSN